MITFAYMEARPLKIFTTSNTPRLRYTADLILGEILGLRWEIVSDRRKLGKHHVINYSYEKIPGSLNIRPSGLLSELGFRNQDIETGYWNRLPVIFFTGTDPDIPFDIFSAVFYLVSRYEEYLEYEPDHSGSFPSSASIAFKNGFLGIPVVDFWSRELAVMLLRKFHNLSFRRKEFRRVTVIDFEVPHYSGKALQFSDRAGYGEDAAQFLRDGEDDIQNENAGKESHVEVIAYINEKTKASNSDVIFFCSPGATEFNETAFLPEKERSRKILEQLSENCTIGLRYSDGASSSLSQMETECRELNELTGKVCRSGIFHRMAFTLPLSYRNLIKAGINEDYSMGYHDVPGFRAGISRPFLFYDLIEEKTTLLRVFPTHDTFTGKDPGSKGVQAYAGENIRNIIREVRKAGGTFASVWYYEAFGPGEENSQWRDFFECTLREQAG